MQIRLIEQNSNSGCGIACVAMLANKSYEDVKEKLEKIQHKRTRKGLLTTQDDISLLLHEFKIDHSMSSYSKIEDIENKSIIAVNKKENGQYHWIVVLKKQKEHLILDPDYGEILRLKHNTDEYIPLKSGKAVDISSSETDCILI